MKKAKDKVPDDTIIVEDIAAFEEWEKKEGGKGNPPKEKLKPAEEDFGADDGFDGLGEPELEPVPANTGSAGAAVKEDQKTMASSLADELVELSPDIPINLVAVIGKTTISISELIKYRVGQTIDLKRAPGETVDLVANGRLIARGELVEMDGKMGVKILKMMR